MITKEQARSLAIAYGALNEANNQGDNRSKALWAESLLELQRATGVVLHSEWVLKHCISLAD